MNQPQEWLWRLGVGALALVGISGVVAGLFHIAGPTGDRPTLNLLAADHGGEVRIQWDPSAAPIVSARKASLLILDGDQKLETTLSPELLHNGSMVYERKSSDVEIRLRVNGADADPVQELTRLTGLPAAPASSPESYEAADQACGAEKPKLNWVEMGKRAHAAAEVSDSTR